MVGGLAKRKRAGLNFPKHFAFSLGITERSRKSYRIWDDQAGCDDIVTGGNSGLGV